jgi:CubicO group peptidase (beta-lactamase class C family)
MHMHRAVRVTILSILIAGLLIIPNPALAAPLAVGPTDPADVEAFFDGIMAAHLAAHHVPGATVAVVADGEVVLAKGYGYADLEQRMPVDAARTLFRPGSVSKLFTWTAVMQQVEAGTLDLEADVNDYLDFTIPDTYPEPITLAHLMTHTPGFEDQGRGLFVLDEEKLVDLETYVKANVPARVFPPGEVGAYSNYGTALAGYIVQRVSGEPFEAYVENHIFNPLAMTHSTFRQPLPAELAPDMAQGYGYASGAFLPGEFELISGSPAGSMSAPAADMARFMIAVLQGGELDGQRILAAETIAEMQAPHFVPDPRSYGMGYGYFRDHRNGRDIVSHGGDTILFHTGLFLLPGENAGLFVSYNSAGGSQARVELLKAFMDRYYPAPEPEPISPPADVQSRIKAYTGEYHMARANYTTMEKMLRLLQPIRVSVGPEGHLVVTLPSGPAQYVEVEPGLLRQSRAEDRLVFMMEDGEVAYAMMGDMPALMIYKPPWYATSAFAGVLLIGGLTLFLLSLLVWLVAYVAMRRRAPDDLPETPARLARWVAVLFVLQALIFLIAFMAIMGDVDPAYGVPGVFFGEAPGLNVVLLLPFGVALLALAMLVMAVLAWIKGYWNRLGRIHYTLLTAAALAWVWFLAFWNLLG